MADNLTLQLKEELAKRGKIVTDSQVEVFLKNKQSTPTPQQSQQVQQSQPQSLWSTLGDGSLPDWYEPDKGSISDNSPANALAAGLWSFTDTALFGIPGLFVEEEEKIDFEDPLAKWLSAGGGFLGFVAGAPLKIGVKLGTEVVAKIAPRIVGKAGSATVLRGMREAGKSGGLSKKAINQTTSGYKRLVQQAQIDKTLQGEKFGQAVSKYRDEYIQLARTNGIIKNADEAAAIRNMFQLEDVAGGINVFKRPLQDIQGLALARYGDTKFGRFIGHAANDVMVFSMIDAVFEGVNTIEDHEYDWTAPLWGAANGIAFSSLSFLNPKGKASSFYKDFKIGVKAAFGKKSPYDKLNERQLSSITRYIGQSLKKNGDGAGNKGATSVSITHKGKEEIINLLPLGDRVGYELGSSQTLAEFTNKFGDDAPEVMKKFLESKRKQFGKDIIKWASKEEVSSLAQVWPRMVLGGLLFNSHSFYEMFANEQDLDFTNDILPHFLIGAYIQRRTNPAKFDLNAPQMSQVRENLALLGFKPDQLSEIPSLGINHDRMRNPLNADKYKKVIEIAESEGIISDDFLDMEIPLSANQKSMGIPENKNNAFDQIYGFLKGTRAYQKPIDNISTESAKKIVDEFKKTNPDVNFDSINSVEKMVDSESLKITEEFENNFSVIIESLSSIRELNPDGSISRIAINESNADGSNSLKTAQHVMISSSILNKAKNGELEFLQSEGQEAVDKLTKAFDGLNSIIQISQELTKTKFNKSSDANTATFKEVDNVQKIYERISFEELRIDKLFPDRSSMATSFSFSENYNDYRTSLLRNHAIRSARGITDIFKPEYQSRNTLIKYFKDAGLIEFTGSNLTEPLLINSIDQIKLIDEGDSEKNAERKRFLGRVLALQSIVGKYSRTTNDILNIDGNKIDILRSKLSDFGYNESNMPMWMHKHTIDFAIREKIEGTELTLGDMDGIMSLSALGMASVGVDVTGTGKKPVGFTVKLIDEIAFDKGSELVSGVSVNDIVEYNRKINDMRGRSDGLINIEQDRVKVVDSDMLKLMNDSLKDDSGVPFGGTPDFYTSAKATLGEFLNVVGTSNKPGSAKFIDTLGKFIEDGGPEAETRALKWLNESGLISLKKDERKFDINLKEFNELIANEITREINKYGVTPEYAERYYQTLEKNSRDRQMLDSGEGDYIKSITMQEFFTRYRVDSKQETPPNEQDALMTDLIFKSLDKKTKISRIEVIDKVLDRLYVKDVNNKDWVKFPEYNISSPLRAEKMKSTMISDFIGLVGGRKFQKSVELIEYKNGRITVGKEVKQFTRLDNFFDTLKIPIMTIDPFATAYLFSEDGRRVERKRINIFGDTSNLTEKNRQVITSIRGEFNSQLGIARDIDGKPTVGENGEVGMIAMRLAPNTSPIAIKNSDLPKIKEKFDTFANLYDTPESLLGEHQKIAIRDIKKSLKKAEDNNRLTSEHDYAAALRRLMLSDMLVGSDGDRLFIDFMNGKVEIDKLFGRTKLYDTKKFVRYDPEFILDVAESYKGIGDKPTDRALKKILAQKGYRTVIWDDESTSNVKEEVKKYIKDNNIDFDLDATLQNAHNDISGFDSIGYVSIGQMRFMHAMMGHDPNSMNPVKPVISSGGENSPLLMGKTLFIYSNELDKFFENNGVDILLTKSGAKALNRVEGSDGKDATTLNNVLWSDLNNQTNIQNKIRTISIESLGLKNEKDVVTATAKRSHADMNYANNEESGKYFNDEILTPLTQSLTNAQHQLLNPVSTRKWILDQYGDDALVSLIDGKESLNHLNGMQFFAGLTRDANPMSYSESIVKNKIYGAYIDPLINNKRAVTNQHDQINSERYGGQAPLIQAPISTLDPNIRLKPTLVDNEGTVKSLGEILLPHYEKESKISTLISKGYEIRIVDNGETYKPEEIFKILNEGKKDKKIDDWQSYLDSDINLELLHDLITTVGIENKRPNLQVGILVRRNPRTRPNDLALMGLKGFLEETYGNSIMINSFDVVNVFEGDYDADKADYFFAEKNNMYEHVKRTSQHFVQGVDPTKYIKPSGFTFGLNSTLENQKVEEMAANNDLYKSSIGLVQKVPRMLNYLGNLGSDVLSSDKSMIGESKSKILYDGDGYRIVMDYDNKDFYQRSALETQYIIDGSGDLNKDIANDIYSWRDSFLFPTIKTSKSPKQLNLLNKNQKIGFTRDISNKGNSNGERVRIFRRLDLKDGTYQETQDISSLDKAVVKEMLSEYGKFLGVTGDTAYEKSGEQRRVKYEDIMSASDRFFKFNANLRASLYYRLRNRLQNNSTDDKGNLYNKEKWYDNDEFKALFGVVEKTSKKYDKELTWFKSVNEKMFNNTISQNSIEFSKGLRGSPIERTLWKMYDKNLFGETRVETLTGDVRKYIDDWYDELVFDNRMDDSELNSSSAKLKENILNTQMDINKKVNLIKSLNKKIMQIKFNKTQTWDRRTKSIEKLNELKSSIEEEIGKEFLTKDYLKSKSSKDLKNIEFVDVNTSNMKKGTIYYSTIEQIKRFMPLINGDDSFGLGDDALNDIKTIKTYRKLFYGSQDNLGEIIKFGGASTLSPEQKRLLEQFPDMNTYFDIETNLLLKGVNKHGLKFLWSFMQPSINKFKIGIFNGDPIAVPFEAKEGYDPSSRYRRGLNLLSQIATRTEIGGQPVDAEVKAMSSRALAFVQVTEAQFERFFNKRFDARKLVSETLGEAFNVGDEMQKSLIYDAIKLPNFNKDFEKRFGDFGTIQWTKTSDRIKNGFGLFNDHLFEFYRDIMIAAGKENEFDTYLKEMNNIQELMMSNNIMNPLQYVHARNKMDKDIRNIAQSVFTTGLKQGTLNTETTNKLLSNPVYALMGGNSFWKGLVLEKQGKPKLGNLKQFANMSKTVENIKLKMPITENGQEKLLRLQDQLIEARKC